MFRSFFLAKEWFFWSILGSIAIILSIWYQVQLDVQINEWFGDFYNLIQNALAAKDNVTEGEVFTTLFTFAEIAGIYIVVAVMSDFFIRHYVFRWRTAMNDYYTYYWDKVRQVEGASQRVQEDTAKFARIIQGLAESLIKSILLLIAFLPILWELSKHVKVIPVFGEVDHVLIYVAIIFAAAGTVLLALVGIKLPGLEFDIQVVEAAYRKELVLGEDQSDRATPPSIQELFNNVRKYHYRYFLHYLYFDIAKWSYLQFGVIVPYLVLVPSIAAAAFTLGVMQQIVRAFQKVESSFQFLVYSWSTIVELISVYKRLKRFEEHIDEYIELSEDDFIKRYDSESS